MHCVVMYYNSIKSTKWNTMKTKPNYAYTHLIKIVVEKKVKKKQTDTHTESIK